MNKIIILLFVIALLSCNNKQEKIELNTKTYNEIKHKINYIDIKQKNGLIKHIGFYPNTKDTFSTFYTDSSEAMKEISKIFYRNGNVRIEIDYESNIRKCKTFYENGNLKENFQLDKQNIRNGIEKEYYETGELKAIYEYIVYKDSIQYTNNRRFLYKNGSVNKDSTSFYEMVTEKDTVSLYDSLKVEFNVEKPYKTGVLAFRGSINNYFGSKRWEESLVLKKGIFYFKPKKTGNNLIEIIFVTVYNNGTDSTSYTKTFLKKEVFVTE